MMFFRWFCVWHFFRIGMGILFYQKKWRWCAIYDAVLSTEGCVMTVIFYCSAVQAYFTITLQLTSFVLTISWNTHYVCTKLKKRSYVFPINVNWIDCNAFRWTAFDQQQSNQYYAKSVERMTLHGRCCRHFQMLSKIDSFPLVDLTVISCSNFSVAQLCNKVCILNKPALSMSLFQNMHASTSHIDRNHISMARCISISVACALFIQRLLCDRCTVSALNPYVSKVVHKTKTINKVRKRETAAIYNHLQVKAIS